jgi:hypothetical protein
MLLISHTALERLTSMFAARLDVLAVCNKKVGKHGLGLKLSHVTQLNKNGDILVAFRIVGSVLSAEEKGTS